ncbi:MAG: response regulator transcription factor [Alphaproteobacteria bacterium]|nr:response regulator transcription factor [Alphaproteobacteria bacterium]
MDSSSASLGDTTPPHVLVVDDDTRLRQLLQEYLTSQGFMVSVAENAHIAYLKLQTLQFDVMVLDWMMPGDDGLSLLQSIRPTHSLPVLMLTALDDTENRITGLAKGADDYLGKPFDPRELVLRLRKLLQRQPALALPTTPTLIRFGRFTFDRERRLLTDGDNLVKLTTAEADLLSVLTSRSGQPMQREEIVALLVDQHLTPRTIDVQINRLRRKLETDPAAPRYLQTVRNRGYVLIGD